MSVRMRHTRAHTGNRRSHHSLREPAVSVDKQDGAHLRHRVSPLTGTYKGKKVLEVSAKKQDLQPEKKTDKKTEKEKDSK